MLYNSSESSILISVIIYSTAALPSTEISDKKYDQSRDGQNVAAEKISMPSVSAHNLDVSDMSPEALADWLVKEIGELYLADINKLKGMQK